MFKRSNEQEKKGGEKREVLLVSFSNRAHFVFAIIHRHLYGMESIPIEQLKPSVEPLSDIVTRDVKKLHVLRADNCKHPFVGLQVGKIFYVFFIEAEFGDIYNHGRKK